MQETVFAPTLHVPGLFGLAPEHMRSGKPCVLCRERLHPVCTGDALRQVCESCLRAYAHQVQDRSHEVRMTCLSLFEAHLRACREGSDRDEAHTAWALYRLGVDLPERRPVLTLSGHEARVWRGYKRAEDLERLLPLEGWRGGLRRVWPGLIKRAAHLGIGVCFSVLGRTHRSITDHMVGGQVELPSIFAETCTARLTYPTTRGAMVTLSVSTADGTPVDMSPLLGEGSQFFAVPGGLTCSRYYKAGVLSPLKGLLEYLRTLGVALKDDPIACDYTDLYPESMEGLPDSGKRPAERSTLLHGLARLGLVDEQQTQPSFKGTRLHLLEDKATGDLLVERFGERRLHRISSRQSARQMLLAVQALMS